MNILETLDMIPFGSRTSIYYNGITRLFIDKNYSSSLTAFEMWGEFGMRACSDGPILNFLINNLPKDTAIICRQGDYHHSMPDELSKLFERCLVIVRYTGIPNSIVIPGDDRFFETPEFYCPKVWMPFEERKHQVFWRGSCTAEGRLDVVTALKNVPGTDVRLIQNLNWELPYWSKDPELFAERCDPDVQSKHTIWLSIEGWGCASDTTRALMSGCAVIYFRKTAPWFDQFLVHEENCIIVENDISKLLCYIDKMMNDIEFTKTIAENGKTLSEKIFKPEFYKQFILDQLTQS